MYRQLNREARAPLPLVHKAIRNYERSAPSAMSDFELNQRLIEILHHFNWRKRDYKAALARRARQTRRMQHFMQKRSAYAPATGCKK